MGLQGVQESLHKSTMFRVSERLQPDLEAGLRSAGHNAVAQDAVAQRRLGPPDCQATLAAQDKRVNRSPRRALRPQRSLPDLDEARALCSRPAYALALGPFQLQDDGAVLCYLMFWHTKGR